jgi:hypothetical protein
MQSGKREKEIKIEKVTKLIKGSWEAILPSYE